jgi:hypothetical protein
MEDNESEPSRKHRANLAGLRVINVKLENMVANVPVLAWWAVALVTIDGLLEQVGLWGTFFATKTAGEEYIRLLLAVASLILGILAGPRIIERKRPSNLLGGVIVILAISWGVMHLIAFLTVEYPG